MAALANPRHERFAQELAKGRAASEAYETAGFAPSRPNASRLQHADNIRQRVAEIMDTEAVIAREATQMAAERLSVNREWVMAQLVENVSRAMQAVEIKRPDGQGTGEYKYDGSVANRSLELLGKEIGMFVDRKEIRSGTLDDLAAEDRAHLVEALRRERERRSGEAGTSGPH